jgi:hypothetical protein
MIAWRTTTQGAKRLPQSRSFPSAWAKGAVPPMSLCPKPPRSSHSPSLGGSDSPVIVDADRRVVGPSKMGTSFQGYTGRLSGRKYLFAGGWALTVAVAVAAMSVDR